MEEIRLTEAQRKTLRTAQQGELDAVLMYEALARAAKDPADAAAFRTLAAEEGGHAAVFRALTGESLKPKRTKAVLLPLALRLAGRKRLYPLIARGEYSAVRKYGPVAEQFAQVESVKNDEQRHGDMVLALLDSGK